MSRLSARFSLCFISLLFVGLTCLAAQAQDTPPPAAKTAHSSMHVTGCLQKGDEPGGLTVTGEDGKLWELHSHTVKLADHAGHKVTLTGHVEHKSKLQETKMEKSEKKEADGKEYSDFEVTGLKMVSDSCQ